VFVYAVLLISHSGTSFQISQSKMHRKYSGLLSLYTQWALFTSPPNS